MPEQPNRIAQELARAFDLSGEQELNPVSLFLAALLGGAEQSVQKNIGAGEGGAQVRPEEAGQVLLSALEGIGRDLPADIGRNFLSRFRVPVGRGTVGINPRRKGAVFNFKLPF